MSSLNEEQTWLTLLSKKRQIYSWETEIISMEQKFIATREVIMVDDMYLL